MQPKEKRKKPLSGVPEAKASGSVIRKFSSLPAKPGHTNACSPVMPASLRNNTLTCACSGIQWNGYLLLPAAGYRTHDSGAGATLGSQGDYWSAEPANVQSAYLYFNNSSTRVGSTNRAYAFPVRCVQEFTRSREHRNRKKTIQTKRFISGVPEVKASGRVICKFSSLPAIYKHASGNNGTQALPVIHLVCGTIRTYASAPVIQPNGYFLLPAAGYRNNSSGAGNNRGSNGNYWSGEVDGTRSSNLNFNSSSASMNTNNRANGFTVRCVQAFTKPFVHNKNKKQKA